jgi:hypothetical protein
MKKVTVKVRKPRTGTDCRMSRAGTMTSSALRLLAAAVATTKVKTSEAARAANIRKVVRMAYCGSNAGFSVTGAMFSALSGRPISSAPWITTTARPASSRAAITSARFGANRNRA